MNDLEFESEMQSIGIRISQLDEMRAAFGQSPDGFELVLARAKGAASPAGALVNLIREGAHLKAGGVQKVEQGAKLFKCNFCGTLGSTNADQHYEHFPWHKDGQPGPPLTYAAPPPKRERVVRSEADAKPAHPDDSEVAA
jgi:hypothetical protein